MGRVVEVHYFLSGRLLFREAGYESLRRGDEICLEGCYYSVARVIRHVGCPPDRIHVHLQMAESEAGTYAL